MRFDPLAMIGLRSSSASQGARAIHCDKLASRWAIAARFTLGRPRGAIEQSAAAQLVEHRGRLLFGKRCDSHGDVVERFDPDAAEFKQNRWPKMRVAGSPDRQAQTQVQLGAEPISAGLRPIFEIATTSSVCAACRDADFHGTGFALVQQRRSDSLEDTRKANVGRGDNGVRASAILAMSRSLHQRPSADERVVSDQPILLHPLL